MEFALLGAAALALGAVWGILWFEAGRTNAADCTRRLWDAALGGAIVGVAVGRVVAMVRTGVNPITNPTDLLIVRGGIDTMAASGAAAITVWWLLREGGLRQLDALAPAAIAGLGGWHAGCLVRNACLGSVTDFPWGIAATAGGPPRHPTEIYAAVLLVVGVVLLLRWKRRHPAPGAVAAAAIAIAAVSRLVTEPLRPGLGDGLELFYGAVVVMSVAALGWRLLTTTAAD